MDNMGSTLFYIVVMVAVLIGAYVMTKYFSKKTRRMMRSKHICVLDRMALAKDKSLYLTEIGGKCILIGVTNQSINTLGEIEKETLGDLPEESSGAEEGGFFGKMASFMSNAKNAQSDLQKARMQAQQQRKSAQQPHADAAADEDILEKLSRAIEQRRNKGGGGNGDQV